MGESGREVVFPTRQQIVAHNRYHIRTSGGLYTEPENLLHPGKLEWVLDAIQHPLFDRDLFPSLLEKAARLSWTIAAGHVFFDGNKRTAVSILLTFLEINWYVVGATQDEVEEEILKVADSKSADHTFEKHLAWLHRHAWPYP